MRKLGILGAMPEEVDLIANAMEQVVQEEYAGVVYYRGRRNGHSITVCCGGMGKANAASATQVLITKYGVDGIIFSGIAGNMNPNIGIGDIVVGKTLCYHDAEDRMLAQSAPGTALYTADPLLVDAASQGCELAGVRYIVGKIATGDQFVGSAEAKRRIEKAAHPDCVEMEGAAVAQTAMRNGVPFVVLRAMSDNAETSIEVLGKEAFDVSSYVKTAASVVLATIGTL